MMIRAWMSKLWHRDGLPKAVDTSPMPLYNHNPSKAIGRILSVEDAKGGIEITYNLKPSEQPIRQLINNRGLQEGIDRLSKAMRGPTPEEAAKMKQVKEFKDSAMLGQNKKPVFCASYKKHNYTFGEVL